MGTPVVGEPGAGAPAGGSPPASGAPVTGSEGGGAALDRSKLNPILRNMSETEVNDLVDSMVQAINAKGGAPAGPSSAAGGSQTPPTPVADPDYREMFDPSSDKFDPGAAVKHIAEKNFGPLVRDVASSATEGLYGQFRERFPDFKDHERDIRQMLQNGNVVAPTSNQVYQLYTSVKGHKATQKELQARESARTAPPSPPIVNDDKKKAEPLDEFEKTVARRMFPDAQDPEAAYRDYAERLDSGNSTMKVPLSGGVRR